MPRFGQTIFFADISKLQHDRAPYGQNLFMMPGSSSNIAKRAVESWYEEIRYYAFNTGRSAGNRSFHTACLEKNYGCWSGGCCGALRGARGGVGYCLLCTARQSGGSKIWQMCSPESDFYDPKPMERVPCSRTLSLTSVGPTHVPNKLDCLVHGGDKPMTRRSCVMGVQTLLLSME